MTLASCRESYPAPPPRTVAALRPTTWGRTDPGDVPAIRAAEQQCLGELSPRAVSAAFQAVDRVAEALVELCSIAIVDDDPLVWHVFCGSDALFESGHYLAASRAVTCDGAPAANAFECIGRILATHLLTSAMAAHVAGVEIVAVGSVDAQGIATDGQFLRDPCTALQGELALPDARRWSTPIAAPSDAERSGVWNRRLSWCRAAFGARELRNGMARSVGSRFELAAIGAGTDWLEQRPNGRCPIRERERDRCAPARRVDLFVRVRAEQGQADVERCDPPSDLPGRESGEALYCYSDCQARAAIGRNPQGYRPPRSRPDLLFGTSRAAAPEGWIVERGTGGTAVNTASVRQLLLR